MMHEWLDTVELAQLSGMIAGGWERGSTMLHALPRLLPAAHVAGVHKRSTPVKRGSPLLLIGDDSVRGSNDELLV